MEVDTSLRILGVIPSGPGGGGCDLVDLTLHVQL